MKKDYFDSEKWCKIIEEKYKDNEKLFIVRITDAEDTSYLIVSMKNMHEKMKAFDSKSKNLAYEINGLYSMHQECNNIAVNIAPLKCNGTVRANNKIYKYDQINCIINSFWENTGFIKFDDHEIPIEKSEVRKLVFAIVDGTDIML